MNEIQHYKACASSLLHDIKTAKDCISFQSLNNYNIYSQLFRDRLKSLSLELDRLYRDVSSYISGL